MKPGTRKLTKKQKFFVAEFLKDYNGTQAAIRAGYSLKRAAETAYDLRHKTSVVMEAIQREENERLERIGVEGAQVLTRMARLGFADIRKIFGPNNTLLDVKDWPDDIVPAVAGVETLEVYEGKGEDRVLIGHTKKVRLWNPDTSLTNMAKNLGVIGNGKHQDEDEEESVVRVWTAMELAAKLFYYNQLIKELMAEVERKKEIEGEKGENISCNPNPNK